MALEWVGQDDDTHDMQMETDYLEHNESRFFFLLTLQIFELQVLADEHLQLDELHFHLMDDTMLDTAELVGVVDT